MAQPTKKMIGGSNRVHSNFYRCCAYQNWYIKLNFICDTGPCDSAETIPKVEAPTEFVSTKSPKPKKSEVSSELSNADLATSSETKDVEKSSEENVEPDSQSTLTKSSDEDMEVDAECSSSETPIQTSTN